MPNHSSAAMIPSVHSGRLRTSSVSSMRSTNVPPYWRAKSQLNSADRAPPTWKYPVGDGANRTLGRSRMMESVMPSGGARTRRVVARGGGASVVLGYGDGSRRAAVYRLLQLPSQLFGRVLVEDVEVPVVAHLEDLGQDAHTDGIAG